MARILYGVGGEGMGHATRSLVVIGNIKKKHNVKVICGDSAYNLLSKKLKGVERVQALRLTYLRNKVSKIKTLIYNLKHLKNSKKSIQKVNSLISRFKPELVISDFEYFSSNAAIKHNIPLIVIDNNHIVSKTKIEVPKRYLKDHLISKLIAKIITRKADFFLITSFFFPPKKEKNVYLFPPILRKEILGLKPTIKDYILVYQTSKSYTNLIPTLKKVNERFIVYSIKDNGKEDNIVYKGFNEKEFFNDLKDCKAVITNGGYSLMGEALYLNKPVLSIPIMGQFEQIVNAYFLKKLGYGLFVRSISVSNINRFLANLDFYRKNLKRFKKEDNKKLFNKIDDIISKAHKPTTS